MNQVTTEQLKEHFEKPNVPNEIRCNMNFNIQDVQEFLNRHGYEIFIREQRCKRNTYNTDGDRNGSYPSLYKRLVCVPIGTVLPDILPEPPENYLIDDDCWNYDLQKTFEKIMRGQMLKL